MNVDYWQASRSGVGLIAVALLQLLVPIGGAAAAEPKSSPQVILPAAVAAHVGETCTVEMQVLSSRRGDTPIRFLNSEQDFNHPDNFTVVIFAAGLKEFKQRGIAEPERHFENKKIRVTGKIEKYRGRPQIRVDDPKQIELLTEEAGQQPIKRS